MDERRLESRYLCADLIRIFWSARGEPFRSSEAVLEDISARGVCVQLDEKIDTGTAVTVALGDSQFEGEVCYCSYRDIGFFVGVQFVDQARWSMHQFEPKHMVNLEALVRLAAG